MKFAFVKDDHVVEIRELHSENDISEDLRSYQAVMLIDGMDPVPQVGWQLSGSSLIDPTGQAKPSKVMSRLKFLERFTDAELGAIEAFSAQSNPYAYALRAAIRKQQVSEFIDLSLPQVSTGVMNLVGLGLLTLERANAILNTPLKDDEKYRGK